MIRYGHKYENLSSKISKEKVSLLWREEKNNKEKYNLWGGVEMESF